MTFWLFIGILAACLTMFGFIPQIARMYRTKSVADISIVTLLQFTLGVSLWAAYGISESDLIIVVSSVVSLSTLIVALALYIHYRQIHHARGISRKEG